MFRFAHMADADTIVVLQQIHLRAFRRGLRETDAEADQAHWFSSPSECFCEE